MSSIVRKTSLMWWEETLKDEGKMIAWLKKQYHGEVTASERILVLSEKYCGNSVHKLILSIIAKQERNHASWVGELLTARGVTPSVLEKEERYWNQTLPGIKNFETAAAVASHAERMRLERIRVIASHPETPADIREVFKRILPEEMFHERAFGRMAGDEALKQTQGNHNLGLKALGLEA